MKIKNLIIGAVALAIPLTSANAVTETLYKNGKELRPINTTSKTVNGLTMTTGVGEQLRISYPSGVFKCKRLELFAGVNCPLSKFMKYNGDSFYHNGILSNSGFNGTIMQYNTNANQSISSGTNGAKATITSVSKQMTDGTYNYEVISEMQISVSAASKAKGATSGCNCYTM
jgi:hypothetical protein